MDKDEIISKLGSPKSVDRRKAAKEISKMKYNDLGEALFQAYIIEQNDSRTWETQVEMLLALGLINYQIILPNIKKIIELNKPHDMITYAASQTYIRLQRKSIHDASPVIEILQERGLSSVDGALVALGHDKMIPTDAEVVQLIKLGWDLHKHPDRVGFERNFLDPRYGLALACSQWKKALVVPFLDHCIKTFGFDKSLALVAENAKQGRYTKSR